MEFDYGKTLAAASVTLGIISIMFWFCYVGVGAIVSIMTGIDGIVMASKAKNEGFIGGIRIGGLVTSIVGLCVGAVILIVALSLDSIALMFI